jgi:2,5-diketo-D-gluconate reductase A
MATNPADPSVPRSSVALPSGNEMPLLGFGTWQIKGKKGTAATEAALADGYRHLDTAHVYRNEDRVGAGLRTSGVSRGDVFITTKVPPKHEGKELETLQQSLEQLGTDYLDLWLIHWPQDDDHVHESLWTGMLSARSQGLVRDVGVSNYSLDQIDRLVSATGEKPAVNQIEWSPLLFDAAVLDGHRDRGVVVEGYSGLRGGILEHPTVVSIAERLGRSTAQVVIRWHLEHGIVVIPKSEHPDRIRSNADVGSFELTAADVEALDALGSTGS